MQRKSETYSSKGNRNSHDNSGSKNSSFRGKKVSFKFGDNKKFTSSKRPAKRFISGDKFGKSSSYSDGKDTKEGERPYSSDKRFKSNDRFAKRRFDDRGRSEDRRSDTKEGERPYSSDKRFKSNDRFAKRRFDDRGRSEGRRSDTKEGERPYFSDKRFKSNDRFAKRRSDDRGRSEGRRSDEKDYSNERFSERAKRAFRPRAIGNKSRFFSEDVRSRLDHKKESLIIKEDPKGKYEEKRKYNKSLLQDRLKISSLDNKKKRTNSSTRWLGRHINDPYVKSSKKEDYRSRAAYKLLEISEKINIFSNAANVVDLGSAPGSWAQVIKRYSKGIQNVVAIDKITMNPIEGVQFIQFDLENDLKDLSLQLPVEKFDIILSDMGPNSCGNTSVDHIRSINLCYAALNFSCEFLKENGILIFKMLQGSLSREFILGLRGVCKKVSHIKPAASREDSREIYVCLESFYPTEATKYAESLNIKNNEKNTEKNIDEVISALSN